MALSNDLISQFAKITKDDKKKNSEQTVYGTVVDYNGEKYLKIDGSDLLTPISSTTRANNDERVTAMIKNHTVTVTGNLTSPAARSGDVETIGSKITEFEVAIGDKVDTKELNAQTARIDELYATDVTIKNSLTANAADIKDLQADNATIKGTLTANSADITNLKAENASITGRVTANEANIGTLQANTANITSKLTAAEADIGELEADNATIHGTLDAHKGYIDDLEATKLSAESADIKYANIDFSNIGKAAMEYFYANSGLIKNVVVGDQTITGNLVGVTISGDLIEGNTIVAEKLVVKGEDGLYYKLNTDGITTEAEQTDYNSLNGSVIRAKSITATQISVSDLVAFGATIGGYKITDSSLYSGVKETVGNTTRGVYLDNDGQFAVGDASNYLKFFQDTDGTYKLEVSASSVKFSSSGKSVEQAVNDAIVSTVEQFYLSTSSSGLSGGSWSAEQPTWEEGKYIWRRTLVTYGNGASEYTPSAQGVCITGNTGAKGDTGATGKGVKSNTRYYCLQASATKPSKPTTNPPDSKWTTTEPSYTTGSTSYLYTVDLTVYTDNNFLYSDVSLSSSYEAAKAAYAKAVNAETEISKTNEEVALKASKNEVTETLKGYATTASMNAAITTKANEINSSVAANYTTKNEFDSLQIGGRNLLKGSRYPKVGGPTENDFGVYDIPVSISNNFGVISFPSVSEKHWRGFATSINPIEIIYGQTVTFSCEVQSDSYSDIYNSTDGNPIYISFSGCDSSSYNRIRYRDIYYDAVEARSLFTSSEWKKFSFTFTVGSDSSWLYAVDGEGGEITRFYLSVFNYSIYPLNMRKCKLEYGNKATDWSPAPEDIESRVASAETRITQTETDIKSKASQTELSGLTTRVSTAEQNISAANAAIEQKASITEVSGLTTRVSTAEQNISAANAAISQKAEKTEVNELSNTINATKTVVDQNSNKWSVAATKVENMRLAGDNILKKQDYGLGEPDSDEGWWGRWVDFSADWLKNISRSKYGFYQGATSASYARFGCIRNANLVQGKTYTLSFVGFCGSPSGTYKETQSIIITWMKNNSAEYISEYYVTVNCGAQMYSITMNSGSDYVTNSTIRFCAYNANGNALRYETWITDIMLTEGEIPARWSPSPFDGAKTTTVTVDHSGMYVNTEGVIEFNTNKFEITPPDGGDQLFSVNASTKNLKAQNGYFTYLSAPNMASKPTSTAEITRAIGNGYYPTIQAAWDSLPDVCGNVSFWVYSDSPGTAVLANKHIGNFNIQGYPADKKFNIGKLDLYGLSGTIQHVTMTSNEGIYTSACSVNGSNYSFNDVTFASVGRGLTIVNGGCACVIDCRIAGVGSYEKPQEYAIVVVGGFLSSYNTYGVAAGGVYALNGSFVALGGVSPGPFHSIVGANIVGNYTIDGTVAEKPTVSQTATFTPSTWCTWECISRSLWKRLSVDVVVQSRSWSGLNNKTQYPNGFCKRAGWWVLDTGTAIKDTLSGKTISRATITIRRDACSETYKVELAYHSVANCDLNGYSVSADYNIANQLISIGLYDVKGDSDTVIDLPSSLYSKLQDGTIKGFGLLNNGTYFKDVYCDGTCTLNVTYT